MAPRDRHKQADRTQVETTARSHNGAVVEDRRAENGRVERPEIDDREARNPDATAKTTAGTTTGSTVVGTSPKELGGPVPVAAGSDPTIKVDVELGAPVGVALAPNAPVGVDAPARDAEANQTAVVAEPLTFDSSVNKIGHGGTPELPFLAEGGYPEAAHDDHPWYGRSIVTRREMAERGYHVVFTESGPPDDRRFRHIVLHEGHQLTKRGYDFEAQAYRFVAAYEQGILTREMADQLDIDYDGTVDGRPENRAE